MLIALGLVNAVAAQVIASNVIAASKPTPAPADADLAML